MLDAVRTPARVVRETDKLGRSAIRYIGKAATVVLNEAGEVVTSWRN